ELQQIFFRLAVVFELLPFLVPAKPLDKPVARRLGDLRPLLGPVAEGVRQVIHAPAVLAVEVFRGREGRENEAFPCPLRLTLGRAEPLRLALGRAEDVDRLAVLPLPDEVRAQTQALLNGQVSATHTTSLAGHEGVTPVDRALAFGRAELPQGDADLLA